MNATPDLTPTGRPCVICNAPAVRQHRPFCSPKCRKVDLNRWLTGVYSLDPDAQADAPEDAPEDVREYEEE